jgi:uncharacterized protein YneF (UPF0154 family)
MMNNVAYWGYLSLLIYPVLIVFGFWAAYFVIRKAIRSGLRQHQEWLDTQTQMPSVL